MFKTRQRRYRVSQCDYNEGWKTYVGTHPWPCHSWYWRFGLVRWRRFERGFQSVEQVL